MAKNTESKTALDIATIERKRRILLSVGAKFASQVTDTLPAVTHRLRSSNPTRIKKNGNFYVSHYKRYIRQTAYLCFIIKKYHIKYTF